MSNPLILLDLNFTLVENSDIRIKPLTSQIAQETYRGWLIDCIRGHRVFLVTARPVMHSDRTVQSIHSKTGWLPEKSFFNEIQRPPAMSKEWTLTERILPICEPGQEFLAIESNPKSQAMYSRHGIPSIHVRENETWETLPTT